MGPLARRASVRGRRNRLLRGRAAERGRRGRPRALRARAARSAGTASRGSPTRSTPSLPPGSCSPGRGSRCPAVGASVNSCGCCWSSATAPNRPVFYAALNELHALRVTAPPALREQLPGRTGRQLARHLLRNQEPEPTVLGTVLRRLATRIDQLSNEVAAIDTELGRITAEPAPRPARRTRLRNLHRRPNARLGRRPPQAPPPDASLARLAGTCPSPPRAAEPPTPTQPRRRISNSTVRSTSSRSPASATTAKPTPTTTASKTAAKANAKQPAASNAPSPDASTPSSSTTQNSVMPTLDKHRSVPGWGPSPPPPARIVTRIGPLRNLSFATTLQRFHPQPSGPDGGDVLQRRCGTRSRLRRS